MSDNKRMIDFLPEEYRAQIRKEVLEEVQAEKKKEEAEVDADIKAWSAKENEIINIIKKWS